MRRALARVFDVTKAENCIPISGKDRLLMTQIAFFDDPARCAQKANELADELEQRIVDGVIDANLKFCTLYDTEKSAVAKALEAEGIPCLGLETDYTDNDAEQLRTRIEAFVEMLG